MKRGIVVAVLVVLALLIGIGYHQATRDPILRTATIKAPPDERSGGLPVRILLMSDAHIEGPETPPDRLSRIVDQANALHADIVVFAGDLLGGSILATKRYSIESAVEPFRRLKAPLGVYAVPGNHDGADAAELTRALQSIGVIFLDDDAAQVGPIALGGFRPGYYRSLRRLHRLNGMKVLAAHSPDQFANVKSIPLMLAGHTHCGQIVLPVVGALATGSQYGTRYLCGLIREPGKTLIVTAGLGTSKVPLRFGAPPDMWLITIE
jgi:predicted MPP superfamily phosphohydrolase